jgi:hypothetical protein
MLLIALSSVFLASCSKDYDKFSGKWSASGDSGDTTDLHSWYIEYEFKGREYTKTGYPPVSEEGKIEIVEERGDSLKFLFYVLKSDPEQKSYEEWMLLKENKLYIGGLELTKAIPGSNK